MNPADLDTLTPEQLRALTAQLIAEVQSKDQAIREKEREASERDRELRYKQTRIDQLTHEISILKRQQFGRRSEQLNSEQMNLLDEAIDGDLVAIEMERVLGKASGIRHTPELRQTAVIDLCTRRGSADEVAKKIGVSRPTLYNWRTRLLGQEAVSTMTRRNDPPQSSEKATLEQQVESLRRDIRKLQIEHDILKKANEILKKGLGINPQLLTNREKTALVDALKQTYTLSELFAELGLARSSYFYHRARILDRPEFHRHSRAV